MEKKPDACKALKNSRHLLRRCPEKGMANKPQTKTFQTKVSHFGNQYGKFPLKHNIDQLMVYNNIEPGKTSHAVWTLNKYLTDIHCPTRRLWYHYGTAVDSRASLFCRIGSEKRRTSPRQSMPGCRSFFHLTFMVPSRCGD